ncbi:MAG: hypothetical protein KAH86_03660, partial [Methanosarcinales archaeon]|nr:hypothetical protein [Methanosarcinales archaeon]
VAAVLEGGYNPAALAESVGEVCNVFDNENVANNHLKIEKHAISNASCELINERIAEIISTQKEYWAIEYPSCLD